MGYKADGHAWGDAAERVSALISSHCQFLRSLPAYCLPNGRAVVAFDTDVYDIPSLMAFAKRIGFERIGQIGTTPSPTHLLFGSVADLERLSDDMKRWRIGGAGYNTVLHITGVRNAGSVEDQREGWADVSRCGIFNLDGAEDSFEEFAHREGFQIGSPWRVGSASVYSVTVPPSKRSRLLRHPFVRDIAPEGRLVRA